MVLMLCFAHDLGLELEKTFISVGHYFLIWLPSFETRDEVDVAPSNRLG